MLSLAHIPYVSNVSHAMVSPVDEGGVGQGTRGHDTQHLRRTAAAATCNSNATQQLGTGNKLSKCWLKQK